MLKQTGNVFSAAWFSCIPNNPFRRGLTMDRSLQGLPPIRRSNGPHSASWKQHVRLQRLKLGCSFCGWDVISVCTHMFLRDGTNVVDVFDLPLVLHHPHGDRILANLWGNVAFDLKSQISEHQIPWRNKNPDFFTRGWRGLEDGSRGRVYGTEGLKMS